MTKEYWRPFCLGMACLILTSGAVSAVTVTNDSKLQLSNTYLSGYFDTEWFSANDSTKNTFKAHRVVLNVASKLHERIFFNSEIEFEYGGLINAGTRDGELKIEQAWVDYTLVPGHYLRGGIVLVPFGVINIKHDSDIRDSTQRPLFASVIVPSTWMDTGFGAHGSFEVGEDWVFRYEGYLLNGLNGSATANIADGNGVRSARASMKADNNNDKALAVRLAVSPSLAWEVGTSFYSGKYDNDAQKNLSMIGADAFWSGGPVEVLGEIASVKVEATSGMPTDMSGYYVEGRYHFFPDFLKGTFLADGFAHPTFTAYTRYGQVDTNTAVQNKHDRTQFTIGMNYRPIETVVVKMEYEINKEATSEISNNGLIGSVAIGF